MPEIPGAQVQVLDGLSHERMAEGFARLDVLALPSRTTPTWKEQFGRVIVEALWCGVPVVGSDSGEIPWLIGLTGGGLVFPEGDDAALAGRLTELREDPALRQRLATQGGAGRAAPFFGAGRDRRALSGCSKARCAHAGPERPRSPGPYLSRRPARLRTAR